MTHLLGLPGKKYGLIIPSKEKEAEAAAIAVKKAAVWQRDSEEGSTDSEAEAEETEAQFKQRAVRQSGGSSLFHTKMDRRARMELDKAIAEDPNVFDYDGVYDTMAVARGDDDVGCKEKTKEKVARKPKYIAGLKVASDKRQRERDRQQQRTAQKEREKEGSEFADKEEFVTSAYKEKLAQMAADDAAEKEAERLNGDVTKRGDMTQFYRSMLDSRTRDGKAEPVKEEPATNIGQVEEASSNAQRPEKQYRRRDSTPDEKVRRSSPGRRKRSRSPEKRRRSRTPEKYRNRSPKRRSRSPKRRGTSPKRRSRSPRRRSRSPKKRSMSPKGRGTSQSKPSILPEKRVRSQSPGQRKPLPEGNCVDTASPTKPRVKSQEGSTSDEATAVKKSKLLPEKRNTEEAVSAAKARYLARKQQQATG